ncbi:MAG: hypothetical protein A3I06_15605, partial [Candidatus Lindowbacteria bacterium RIFCSPLOWO2_02_FULL_62_12]
NKFPAGWNEQRVKKVLRHYETQSDEAAAAEDDIAFSRADAAVMEIPKHLVPDVRELLARKVA